MPKVVIEAVKGDGRRRGAERSWAVVKISGGSGRERLVTVPSGSAFEGRPQPQRVAPPAESTAGPRS